MKVVERGDDFPVDVGRHVVGMARIVEPLGKSDGCRVDPDSVRYRLHDRRTRVGDACDEFIGIGRITSGSGMLKHVDAGVQGRLYRRRLVKVGVYLRAAGVRFAYDSAIVVLGHSGPGLDDVHPGIEQLTGACGRLARAIDEQLIVVRYAV